MTEETQPDDDIQQPETEATDAALEAEQFQEEPIAETRDAAMDRMRAEVQEAEKRVLLAQAEAENFRKRMRRDYEDQIKFSPMAVVTDILQVRDNLIRAIEAADAGGDIAGLKEGVEMVAKQLDDALAKHSVREIPAEGELFDPNYHEAISQMPSAEHPEGTIAHVAQTGFQMYDRVIRPSQVVVSTGPANA